MSEESTPDQQLIATTTHFARTLLSAGCSSEFICEQAFQYAINAQVQKHRLELAMMCANGGDYSIDRDNTGYMDIAAQVLVEVVKALEIHPHQQKREDRNQVEPNYKQILINLCAGACLADHLGDINENIDEALIQAGILTREETKEFEDAHQRTGFLVLEHHAKTLYGTSLADE